MGAVIDSFFNGRNECVKESSQFFSMFVSLLCIVQWHRFFFLFDFVCNSQAPVGLQQRKTFIVIRWPNGWDDHRRACKSSAINGLRWCEYAAQWPCFAPDWFRRIRRWRCRARPRSPHWMKVISHFDKRNETHAIIYGYRLNFNFKSNISRARQAATAAAIRWWWLIASNRCKSIPKQIHHFIAKLSWIGIDNRLISCLYYNAILWWWWLRGLSRLQHRHRKVKFISTIGSFNINYLLLRDPIERNKQNVLWSVALHPKVLSIFAAATTTRYGPANEDHQKIYL